MSTAIKPLGAIDLATGGEPDQGRHDLELEQMRDAERGVVDAPWHGPDRPTPAPSGRSGNRADDRNQTVLRQLIRHRATHCCSDTRMNRHRARAKRRLGEQDGLQAKLANAEPLR
jgi:hypothetical protein